MNTTEEAVSPEQARLLAALANLQIQDSRMASLATRLDALRSGNRLISKLPLREFEPAGVFRLERN